MIAVAQTEPADAALRRCGIVRPAVRAVLSHLPLVHTFGRADRRARVWFCITLALAEARTVVVRVDVAWRIVIAAAAPDKKHCCCHNTHQPLTRPHAKQARRVTDGFR